MPAEYSCTEIFEYFKKIPRHLRAELCGKNMFSF